MERSGIDLMADRLIPEVQQRRDAGSGSHQERSEQDARTPRGNEYYKDTIYALGHIDLDAIRFIIASNDFFVKERMLPSQPAESHVLILWAYCGTLAVTFLSDRINPMPALKKFTVGLVQMAMGPDPDKNLSLAIAKIEEASDAGAHIVCLPELFRSRYFCQTENAELFQLAEPVSGPTTKLLGKLAKKLKLVLIAPIFERRAAGIYHNSAVVIDSNGEIAGLYRKMHIPDDPSYYEKFYFTPGDLGFQAFDTRVGRISTLICWDQWYPEAARLSALKGACLLFYPTAIGWHPHEKKQHGKAQREAWQIVQRGHAIANGLYVAAVNRVGHEKPAASVAGIEFWGSSFIADPQGVVVAEASVNRSQILLGEVDLEHLEDIRRNWPYLRDRRIDSYDGITSRYLDGNSPTRDQ
jgi:N-carbamoylputrescine amidase